MSVSIAQLILGLTTAMHHVKSEFLLIHTPAALIHRADWPRFARTILDSSTLMPHVAGYASGPTMDIDDIRFLHSHRPEPTEIQLANGDWHSFLGDEGIIRAIRFTDKSTWDAVDGWK